MRNWIRFFMLGFGLSLTGLQAQDIHFTQYYASPLTLNPAHTGYFYGTARLSGIYRQQGFGDAIGAGAGQTASLYTTYSLNVDAPIVLGLSERHWVGVGGAMINDVAGSFQLGMSGFHGNVGYHIGLGKSEKSSRRGKGIVARVKEKLKDTKRVFVPSNSYISIGAGYGNRTFALNRLNPPTDKPIFEDPLAESVNMNEIKFSELNLGVMFSTKLSDESDLQFGISSYHVLQDRAMGSATTQTRQRAREEMKISAHAAYNAILSDKISIHPRLLYRTTETSTETTFQGVVGYRFDAEKDITLFGGVGYRASGSAQAILGGKIKDLRVGLAYDASLGNEDLAAMRQALELSAQYIIKIFKRPQADPVIFCPRL